MTPDALFWLMVGPGLGSVVAAILADAFAREHSVTTPAIAALLGAGGLVGIVGGWSAAPQAYSDVFAVGSGYSPTAGLIMVLSAVALAGSVGSRFGRSGQWAALVTLAAVGSALAVLSSELLVTLLCLEISAVSSYALVAAGRDRGGREAALKYFVQGALASGLFVMGVAAIAGGTSGDLSYASIVPLAMTSVGGLPVLAAVSLIIVAIAFKASAAPLHTWAPDAYEHAPAPAAAVLAGPAKLGAMTVLGALAFRVFAGGEGLFSSQSVAGGVALLLGVLAVLSVLIGSLSALGQASYRRMLGYAGVAQVGYGLIAISSVNPSAAIVHLSMYAIASVSVFLAASAFAAHRPGWDGSIAGLGGIGRRHPVLGAAVLVALASLAGLPPFAGFWGKFQAFGAPVGAALSTFQVGQTTAAWGYVFLVAAGLIGSVVSVAYYGAVVRELFFGTAPADECGGGLVLPDDAADDNDARPATAVVVVIALILFAIGILPLVMSVTGALRGLILVG